MQFSRSKVEIQESMLKFFRVVFDVVVDELGRNSSVKPGPIAAVGDVPVYESMFRHWSSTAVIVKGVVGQLVRDSSLNHIASVQ